MLATGYELIDPLEEKRHKIISTWAIATKRQDRNALWPGQCLIWEASDPYIYLRTTHEGASSAAAKTPSSTTRLIAIPCWP